jgi:protein-L-isoaspartate(D-aspartate) O-methyltransferase
MEHVQSDARANRSARLRTFYPCYGAACGGASYARIEQTFATVPREAFAGPAPWFIPTAGPWSPGAPGPSYIPTPDDDPAFLYQDSLIALDPIRGINVGQPSLYAHRLDALALQPKEIAVHVGAASGYYTVIRAHLAGQS